jgi:hypothetical protein
VDQFECLPAVEKVSEAVHLLGVGRSAPADGHFLKVHKRFVEGDGHRRVHVVGAPLERCRLTLHHVTRIIVLLIHAGAC